MTYEMEMALRGIAVIMFVGCTVRAYSLLRYFYYVNWIFSAQLGLTPRRGAPASLFLIFLHSYIMGPLLMLTRDGLSFFRVLSRSEVVKWIK